MFLKFISLLFLLEIFLFSFVFSLENENFYCSNRFYCDIENFSYKNIEKICDLIKNDDRFLIFLSNKINFDSDYSFTEFSQNFFDSYCKFTKFSCDFNINL